MLHATPHVSFQPLSQRDLSMIQTLRSQLYHAPDWIGELDVMEDTQMKCDIEAMFSSTGIGYFTEMVAHFLQYEMTSPLLWTRLGIGQ